MNFSMKGCSVKIRGYPTLAKTLVTRQALRKETKIEVVFITWGTQKAEQDLRKVLKDCEGIFGQPRVVTPYGS